MDPQAPLNIDFGGGASSTLLHPIIVFGLIVACLIILFAPRKYVPIPFLLLTFLGGIGQQFYVSGLHFYVLRILTIAGIIRLIISKMAKRESVFAGGMDSVDKLFIVWVCIRCTAITLRDWDPAATIYQAGFFLDWAGAYLLFRYLLRDQEDIVRVIKVFAALTCIFALTMVDEKFHNQNIFGYLGALPVLPTIREGSIRAQAAFAHPILAGAFGVVLMPLFWWMWGNKKTRVAGILGFLGSFSMILMSASSTPVMAFAAAIVAWCAWPFRNKLRVFRWGVVIAILALHMVMKAPVWMLIARIDLIAGNSGYHRAMLIDQCIRHFWDWWLIGTNAAASWGWDMWDLSNQFVQEADEGGLITFVCFVLIIAKTFSKIGRARKAVEGQPEQERFMWLLGVTLVTHCVCFFGITYFDATRIVWFAFLSIVTAATAPILATATSEQPAESPLLIGKQQAGLTPRLSSVRNYSARRQQNNLSISSPK